MLMDPSANSDTTTLSPTPFSPFSSAHSFGSEGGTSDEPADLGQFTTVFRALNELQTVTQPHVRIVPAAASSSSSAPIARPLPRPPNRARTPTTAAGTATVSSMVSDYDSDAVDASTVWNQGTIADYLSSSSNQDERHRFVSRGRFASDHDSPLSDTEGEGDGEGPGEAGLEGTGSADQPSLGYLDGVLGFIAAEREKLTARRETGPRGGGASSQASTSESAWRHVVEPRRKRRRKRGKHASASRTEPMPALPAPGAPDALVPAGAPEPAPDGEADGEAEAEADGDGSSSELDADVDVDVSSSPSKGKSLPATPPRVQRARRRQRPGQQLLGTGSDANVRDTQPPRLAHSRSTPSLRPILVLVPAPRITDPRMLRLRTLANKLRLLFPEDARWLSVVLAGDVPDSADSASSDFIDPRGRPPEPQDPLTHVFIDHSNILIGFLNYLKRFPPQPARRGAKTHLSHAALALVLERGRPVARRVLATSSPLYQPMDTAKRLGYSVHVYARVPDTGDGADRVPREPRARNGAPPPGHARRLSAGAGGTSADSDTGTAGTPSFVMGHSRHSSFTSTQSPPNGPGAANGFGGGGAMGGVFANGSPNGGVNGRVRYREQGVDELLQLKLHQAIAVMDVAPSGATIVLATGDGNVGEFNDEGFLGCVRTALKKGWRVELYAWEVGLSKAWVREFGEGPYSAQFRIIGLEKFGGDLLETV